MAGDSSALVTVQRESAARIWVGSGGAAASAREIAGRLRTSGAQLDWVGDSSIVFDAPDSKQRPRLWIAAPDGTSQRQLSNPARISWTFWPEEYMIPSWPTIPDWVQNMLF